MVLESTKSNNISLLNPTISGQQTHRTIEQEAVGGKQPKYKIVTDTGHQGQGPTNHGNIPTACFFSRWIFDGF